MKRTILCCLLASLFAATKTVSAGAPALQQYLLYSPDSSIQLKLYVESNQLKYSVKYRNATVVEPSRLALVINNVLTGNVQALAVVKTGSSNTTYPSRGVHNIAVDHHNEVVLAITDNQNAPIFTVDAKAFNNGIAFCYTVSMPGSNTINEDSTTYTLPPATTIWRQDDVSSYEGEYKQQLIEDVGKLARVGPPLTAQVTNGTNAWMAITEAGNTGFAGMSLRYEASRVFNTVLKGESTFTDSVQTPWHVIEIGKDLNTLVNCDIIQNVSPKIDNSILPDGYNTTWIKPGKSVWSWLSETDGGLFGVSYANMQRYSTLASQLGFQYNLVDEGWAYWSDGPKDYWALLKELVDSSAKKNVKIFVWKAYSARLGVAGIKDSAARWDFFTRCKEAGVAGVKIDFFPGEQQSTLQWYEDALRDAAKLELMIDFHGTDKPTGQSFTWPNEMTREGIKGLENPPGELAVHNTILPFTRFLAGHADYTPLTLNPSLTHGTTLAQQLATVVTFTSPFMCIGANPDSLLLSPVKDIVKDIPTEWDETIVLPQSRPGVLSAFARRKGHTWYLAVINGKNPTTLQLNLDVLPAGTFDVLAVQDDPQSPTKVIIQQVSVNNQQKFKLALKAGGGFVAKLTTGVLVSRR